MRLHAPNPISIFILPAPPPLGALPPYPGREGGGAKEGREGKGRREGDGKGRVWVEVCVIAVGVIDAPGVR